MNLVKIESKEEAVFVDDLIKCKPKKHMYNVHMYVYSKVLGICLCTIHICTIPGKDFKNFKMISKEFKKIGVDFGNFSSFFCYFASLKPHNDGIHSKYDMHIGIINICNIYNNMYLISYQYY